MLSQCQYTGNVLLDAYRLLIADVYELAGASRRTSDDLARSVGQTAARWHVLSALSDGPRTVPSTARRLGLAPQSVQRVVDDLVRGGQMAATVNPDHVRSQLFELTEAGRATLTALFAQSDAVRGEMLQRSGLTEQQLDGARTVIRALLSAISACSGRAGASRETSTSAYPAASGVTREGRPAERSPSTRRTGAGPPGGGA